MPASLSPEQIWIKIKWYCQYQERSHFEVQQKLREMGVRQEPANALLSRLIDEDYINEERFAIQFAGGKFRIKQWGRVKIKYELIQKKVSIYNIKKGLASIDEHAYHVTLQNLAAKKWKEQKGLHTVKKQACYNYLLQKGYESDIIRVVLANLES